MKRSKLLDKISCFIHQNRRATHVWTSDQLADEILKMCDEVGMKPPVNLESATKACTIENIEHYDLFDYCEWDEE